MDREETALKRQEWQAKILAGTISDDEYRAAVQSLRSDRVGAGRAGVRNRMAKGPPKTSDQMLDELDSL